MTLVYIGLYYKCTSRWIQGGVYCPIIISLRINAGLYQSHYISYRNMDVWYYAEERFIKRPKCEFFSNYSFILKIVLAVSASTRLTADALNRGIKFLDRSSCGLILWRKRFKIIIQAMQIYLHYFHTFLVKYTKIQTVNSSDTSTTPIHYRPHFGCARIDST